MSSAWTSVLPMLSMAVATGRTCTSRPRCYDGLGGVAIWMGQLGAYSLLETVDHVVRVVRCIASRVAAGSRYSSTPASDC